MLLEIAPATGARPPPVCTPFLMPFHISYTGPAPVSRYLRPRPAPAALIASTTQSSSTATLVAASSSTSILSGTEKSTLMADSSTTSVGSVTRENENEMLLNEIRQVDQVAAARPATTETDAGTHPALVAPLDSCEHISAWRNVKRLVAAFRGRQMYGQAVDIPNGYGGLVLRTPKEKVKVKVEASPTSLSQKAKPKSKTCVTTRRSKRVTVDDTADEPRGEDGDYYPDLGVDPLPVARKLIPSSTFTSFMLWTPDRPLDEGRDEYVKTLSEWTRLAAEIHSYDD